MYSTVREKGLGEYFIFTFTQRGGRGTLTTVNKDHLSLLPRLYTKFKQVFV